MSPFQLRLELLKMAKELLMDEYYSNKDRITSDWSMKCENAKLKGETPPEHPLLPTIPSEQDIITKATTLNGFVSNISTAPEVKVSRKNS